MDEMSLAPRGEILIIGNQLAMMFANTAAWLDCEMPNESISTSLLLHRLRRFARSCVGIERRVDVWVV